MQLLQLPYTYTTNVTITTIYYTITVYAEIFAVCIFRG